MIRINGEEVDIENISLNELLKKRDYRTDRIAVEVNGHIIKKNDYPYTNLISGDTVEIVSFVGGG